MCLNHTQYCNDMIIFRNRESILWNGDKKKEEENKKKWKDRKGVKRKVLL